MIIGVPKEIKNHEYRVGMVPASVRELVNHGHQVIVETDAGMGIGFTNEDYTQAGAEILATAADVFAKADMIVKVKSHKLLSVQCYAKTKFYLLTFTLHLIFHKLKTLLKAKRFVLLTKQLPMHVAAYRFLHQ